MNLVDWDYFAYLHIVHSKYFGIVLKDINGWLLQFNQQTLGM